MTIDERLQNALASTGLPTSPNQYTGKALEYITWKYNEIPELFADSEPGAARYMVMVNYYLPAQKNPRSMKRRIRAALVAAGCLLPTITNASDKEGQHYVFECEAVDGGDYGES